MSNAITDKIIGSFENVDDLKEYCTSQYTTIIAQSKKIHELEKKLETLEQKLVDSERKVNVASALSIEQVEGTSDTETVCVIQIAMLKGLAMNRELVLEEVKKLEIFAKTLMLIRGKPVAEDTKKKESGSRLTTEQLLALASSLTEQ